MKNGLLLINLGTPDAPDNSAIRNYLKEFLADKRVITLPAFFRYLLLYAWILPFRPRRTTHAYQMIWSENGSPLLYHSQNLCKKLQEQLGMHCKVALGMRYGQPSIENALDQLKECENLIILPLYPQYSSATTGSSIEKTLQLLAQKKSFPSISLIRDFHQHQRFIAAQAETIKPFLATHDYLLFSFHGIPENHIIYGECKLTCRVSCAPDSPFNSSCYRAQCNRTMSLLAKALGLKDSQYGIAFQSRLGKTAWIKPYTDQVLPDLAARGIKRLAIVCPSFVADCLETLEEIGIRAKAQWLQLGGEHLTLLPCVNDNDLWVEGILEITSLR